MMRVCRMSDGMIAEKRFDTPSFVHMLKLDKIQSLQII